MRMKYFSIAELSRSSAATKLHIDNTPDKEATKNLETLVAHILDPAREQLGMPITVNSGFRSQLVNRFVGGNPSSQHLRGEAADICCKDNNRLLGILKSLPYDQLIAYRSKNDDHILFLHVSFTTRRENRHVAFSLYR